MLRRTAPEALRSFSTVKTCFKNPVKNIDFLSVLPFSLRISGNRRIGVARFLVIDGEEIAEILPFLTKFGSESFLGGAK
jgi:hypothetical protein